jgi:transposase
VHKDTVAATVRVSGSTGQRVQETRTFPATTRGLLTLADWLDSYGVTVVGMESTGCYWKPVVRHEVPFDLVGMKGPHLRAVAAVC